MLPDAGSSDTVPASLPASDRAAPGKHDLMIRRGEDMRLEDLQLVMGIPISFS